MELSRPPMYTEGGALCKGGILLNEAVTSIRRRLFALQDEGYRAFHSALMPTVDPARVIGVRMPALRRLAKELFGTRQAQEFLCALPHGYYEEDNLHGLLICALPGYDETVAALERFLPYVDNWATCDLLAPRAFAPHPPALPGQIGRWISSGRPYTVRFAIGMLNRFYLDEAFDPAQLDAVAAVRSDEYYVNMMRAWYFATALAKQYDAAAPWLLEYRLDRWTHNKTIQKAVESFRISPERKALLKTLRLSGRG